MTAADILPYLTGCKEIVVTGVALCGAVIAVRGLTTWQRQLRGQTHFDVARRLLRTAYKLRAAIIDARSPLVLGQEQSKAAAEFQIPDDLDSAKAFRHGQAAVYRRRWNTIVAASIDFEAEIVEAHVLWGEPVQTVADGFRGCIRTLWLAIDDYTNHLIQEAELDAPTLKETRAIIFATGREKDPLNVRLAEAMGAVEALVRPHLKLD